MFSMDNLLKMAGISSDELNQLMALKSMLDKLPKDERTRVVTNFINELQDAVKKVEDK